MEDLVIVVAVYWVEDNCRGGVTPYPVEVTMAAGHMAVDAVGSDIATWR